MPATLLATHRVEKPWGRRQLRAPFGDSAADGEPVGEIWFQAPGDTAPDLLIKYLFTSEKLSVQVHPNDEHAHVRGLPRGKDECWLILDAGPGATIALGTKTPVDKTALRAAALDGSIEQLLDWKPVKAGDFFYVPSGTVHALGAGLTLIEVQQNSETTYRLYDYGRPRELHLDDGVAVADARPYTPYRSPARVDDGSAILVDGPKFALERFPGGDWTIAVPADGTAWLIPVAGEGLADGVAFKAGECLALTGTAQIAADADADLLLAYPLEGQSNDR
ncbi:class I mannose-6-phosphate isomerase [Sphingomonas sp. BT-65]|uniref:class I mannose-6-phosphate isomerase n=1 Tax=Sphingomonas sp. BT-65 TaxID=2989821 RepID=UPI002235435B|nr:class I mannose-6-phosphate isomerase [Sphingomonas sp. BT-65]MCW4463820.1 class I mannose-6-phosphate isomerase [Sphingomonas sp. BT-65]